MTNNSQNSRDRNKSNDKGKKHRVSKPGRPDWLKGDLPAFLDASASVSATTFGARRLPEIKSLWRVCVDNQPTITFNGGLRSGGGKTASRHLRRRTASHKSRRRHRFPEGSEEKETDKPPSCRKARRRPNLLREQHEVWAHTSTDSSNNLLTNTAMTVNWIPTHLWHTKRFHMETLFGWKVPLQHCNRGARAILRMVKDGHSTVQDVTWRNMGLVVGCQQLSTLLQTFKRLCPSIITENVEAIMSGDSFGEGILHKLDCFPNNAIAPAKWYISQLQMDGRVQPGDYWWIHIFVHPCIIHTLEVILTDISKNNDWTFVRRMGMATLQLRGENATSHLFSVLNLNPPGNSLEEMDQILPHLSVVGHKGQVKFIHSHSLALEDPTLNVLQECHTLLVRQCSQKNAYGVMGWDILCLPTTARDIFMALSSTHGMSRAIGILEEDHLNREADPPIPNFPRDYPDTTMGQLYWDPGKNQSMRHLRKTLENGWGRLKSKESNVVVKWTLLVSNDKDNLVVIRGNFGQPFVELLQMGAGSYLQSQQLSMRRNRRMVQPLSAMVFTPPLTNKASKQYGLACTTLLQSLSLPAIIQCQLYVHGRGTIVAGDQLLIMIAGSTQILGYATYGGFSSSRGLCHGSGFISAARLLTLLQCNSLNCIVIHPSNHNVGVQVAYCDHTGNTKGMLDVLLSLG